MQYRGTRDQLILSERGPMEEHEAGYWTASITWSYYPYADAVDQAPRVNVDKHPDFEFMVCKSNRILWQKPGLARIVSTYEGSETKGDLVVTRDEGGARIEVIASMREEPIESHPNFTQWAGTPSAPIGGIFEDDTERFLGWKNTSAFYGISSYLVPTVTLRRQYHSDSKPNVTNIGKVYASPSGAPESGSRNWMLTSIPFQSEGEGYSVTEEYLMSGPRGWSEDLYG